MDGAKTENNWPKLDGEAWGSRLATPHTVGLNDKNQPKIRIDWLYLCLPATVLAKYVVFYYKTNVITGDNYWLHK